MRGIEIQGAGFQFNNNELMISDVNVAEQSLTRIQRTPQNCQSYDRVAKIIRRIRKFDTRMEEVENLERYRISQLSIFSSEYWNPEIMAYKPEGWISPLNRVLSESQKFRAMWETYRIQTRHGRILAREETWRLAEQEREKDKGMYYNGWTEKWEFDPWHDTSEGGY